MLLGSGYPSDDLDLDHDLNFDLDLDLDFNLPIDLELKHPLDLEFDFNDDLDHEINMTVLLFYKKVWKKSERYTKRDITLNL